MKTHYKPIPFGLKLRKLYAKQFYLSQVYYRELLSMLEHGLLSTERDAIEYVDAHGEWL